MLTLSSNPQPLSAARQQAAFLAPPRASRERLSVSSPPKVSSTHWWWPVKQCGHATMWCTLSMNLIRGRWRWTCKLHPAWILKCQTRTFSFFCSLFSCYRGCCPQRHTWDSMRPMHLLLLITCDNNTGENWCPEPPPPILRSWAALLSKNLIASLLPRVCKLCHALWPQQCQWQMFFLPPLNDASRC